jgi:hypothetical protein
VADDINCDHIKQLPLYFQNNSEKKKNKFSLILEQKKFEKKLVSTLTLSGGPASNKNLKGRIELIYVNLIGRIELIYVNLIGRIKLIYVNLIGRIKLIYVNLIGRIEFIYVISIIIKTVWKFII